MTVDSHARIVLSLGQEKDFTPNLGSLLKLGPIIVEAGQSAKDGKKLGDFALPLEHLERVAVRIFYFARVAVNCHQRPGEARSQHDLLHRPLWARGRRGKNCEKVGGDLNGGVVPTLCVVEEPQAVNEPIQLSEIFRSHPVPPGTTEVCNVGRHRLQRRLASRAGEMLPLALSEVGEIRGVGSLGGLTQLGLILKPLRRVTLDGFEHVKPRLALSLHLPQQAVVHKRGEVVQRFAAAYRSAYGLDGYNTRSALEHRQLLEQQTLALREQLVTPLDCSAQRTLPRGRIRDT